MGFGKVLVAGAQIEGHGIERVHQEAHFIIGFGVHLEFKITLGDTLGGGGQFFERPGDSPGNIETEPDRGKDKPGFDYTKEFGGVRYVFLRGVDPERRGQGVHKDCPDPRFLEALDKALIDQEKR